MGPNRLNKNQAAIEAKHGEWDGIRHGDVRLVLFDPILNLKASST
jgi:hypothetical protein